MQRRRSRVQALVGVLIAGIVAALAAWRYEQPLKDGLYWFTDVRCHVLTPEAERVLEPGVIVTVAG